MMFQFGIILLFIGAVLVYGTRSVSRILKMSTTKQLLAIKLSGLIIALVGAIMLLLSQFPERLQFLRIIRF